MSDKVAIPSWQDSFPTLMRAEQVAHILNISRALAYRLIQQGQIVSIKIGTAVRVRQSDLEDFISRNLHGVN